MAREGGEPEKETLQLNLARDGKPYTYDENGDLWRSYAFVKDTVTYERTDDPALFREAGRCFGRFHDLLDDFDASLLHETIPYFHHEPRRWQDFLRAVEENREPAASARDAQMVLEMIQGAYASQLAGGRAMAIPLTQRKHPLEA